MRGVEKVKEFLRPFVDSRAWDFCVIWKLGDDPSRFIEWVGCCCSGGYIDKNIKLENGEETEKKLSFLCRDEHNKHHIKTLACEALSHFPLSMPLYPGIHGEIVMSKSPKWLVNHQGNGSGPGSIKDIFSTRVLVPVNDGLIELFSFTMKPIDENMVDSIISRCNTFLRGPLKPFPEQTLKFLIIPRADESMSTGLNLSSSHVSNPSNEAQNLVENSGFKAVKKLPKENYKSKNLHTERKRRSRITQGIYALRALVPNITKMNKAGTLGDAVDYIKQLLAEKQKLEDELKGINEMELKEIDSKEKIAISDSVHQILIPETEKVSSKLNKKVNNEVNLEVHEIGERGFLIKATQEHKRDGFKNLIEAIDSSGLEIINVNFTKLDLTAMAVLNVKAKKDGIGSASLRDFLLKLIT